MNTISKKDYQRLKKLISLGANVVLKSKEHRKEYEDLHLLIEGFKPSCTGCSTRGKLEQWKRKYQSVEREKIKVKTNINIMTAPKNTFKLKRNYPRVIIPFSTTVITERSNDDVVRFFLNSAETEEERKRREGFFEKLPETPKEDDKPNRAELIEEYIKLFGKEPKKNTKTETLVKKIADEKLRLENKTPKEDK